MSQPINCRVLMATSLLMLLICDSAFCHHHEVKRNKGVGNRRVMVGFLFHHKIPDDAFSGDVAEYQVGETCNGVPLPSWLEFDPSTRTFTGFTQASDVNSTVFICVKAIGKKSSPDSPPSVAKDVFSIEVDVGLTPAFVCPETDTVVLATVYADFTLSELEKPDILKILDSVGSAFGIPAENVRLTRLIKRYNPIRFPILFSGKGDSTGPQQHQGARIQVQAGCSGDTVTEDNPVVHYLQQNAPTGELSRVIGYPVMDWTVAKGYRRPKSQS